MTIEMLSYSVTKNNDHLTWDNYVIHNVNNPSSVFLLQYIVLLCWDGTCGSVHPQSNIDLGNFVYNQNKCNC